MEAILKFINKTYLSLARHAFQTNPHGHQMFQDWDDLIGQKENFIDYIKFEYSLAIFYNIVVSVPSWIYFFTRLSAIFSCDLISSLFLLFVSWIKLIESIPKGILIYQTIRISNNSSDPIICSRRWMYMTRSNIFFYNTMWGYVLLITYTLYFLLIRRTIPCEYAPQFYFIINWLVFGFFLRWIISFINYFLHFKYAINEADINNDLYQDYSNRVPDEVWKMIESLVWTKENIGEWIPWNDENERDICAICMISFTEGETIKWWPCDRKHLFHKACIEKWLKHNKHCPTCRREINKKLINKTKIY